MIIVAAIERGGRCSLFTGDVTDSADGVNQLEGKGVIDLLAQAADGDVDDIRVAVEMHVPDLLGDDGPRQHFALTADEEPEEGKLFRGQSDLRSSAQSLPPNRVDDQIAEAEALALTRLSSPEVRPDARQQLGEGERFDEIVIAAEVEPFHAIFNAVAGREEDDRHFLAGGANPAHDTPAIETGQHHVADDEVEVADGGQIETGFAVRGDLDHEPRFAKTLREVSGGLGLVFDQKDPHAEIIRARGGNADITKSSSEGHPAVMRRPYDRSGTVRIAMTNRLTRDRLLLISLAVILFTAGLGLRDPWPADEPRFALVAKEMVESGDWLIPHRAGEVYADKPPLFFWSVALFYLLTGSLRVAFLLPAAIAGLIVVLLVHDLAARLWSRKAALLAGLTLLSTVQFVMQARSGQIDGFLILWTTLALYGIFRYLLTDSSLIWWYAGFAAAGAGVVTKGVGFLPLLALIPAAIVQRPRRFTLAQLLTGLAVTFGVVLLWLVPMLIHVENSGDPALQAYRDNILFKQTGQRYANAWHHRHWFGYFLFQVIPWAWFPVTLLLPWSLPALWRRLRRGDERIVILCGWILLVLTFFSLSPGKRGVYLLPLVPALVLAHAPLLPGLLRSRSVRRAASVVSVLFAAMVAVFAIVIAVKRSTLAEKLDGVSLSPLVTAVALIAAVLVTTALVGRRKPAAAVAAMLGLFWLGAGWLIMPQLNRERSGAAFMRAVESHVAGAPVGILGWREQFVLQASVPTRTFGYGRSDFAGEAVEGARWVARDRSRWILYSEEYAGCFDEAATIEIGEASRRHWHLAQRQAVRPDCLAAPRDGPSRSASVPPGRDSVSHH
jgi:4-amino-4-deoxy-L-arabinose transferase-like glycosyltransferase